MKNDKKITDFFLQNPRNNYSVIQNYNMISFSVVLLLIPDDLGVVYWSNVHISSSINDGWLLVPSQYLGEISTNLVHEDDQCYHFLSVSNPTVSIVSLSLCVIGVA